MVNNRQWTWTIPTKKGWYWFCGTLWGKWIDTLPIWVHTRAGEIVCTVFGYHKELFYPQYEKCHGVWMEMDIPEAPIYETRRK